MRVLTSSTTSLRLMSRRGSQLALRWFLLLWFVVSSVGLPLGFMSNNVGSGQGACAANPGSECRCSPLKKLSGACCCSKANTLKLVTSSDSRRNSCHQPSAAPKSCCSNRSLTQSGKSAAAKQERSDEPRIVAIESCPCGPDSNANQLVNHEPRLPVATTTVPFSIEASSWLAPLSERDQGERFAPPTPPPKLA